MLAPHGASGNPADSPVAFLRQRMYIVVRERDKSYVNAPYAHQGREMPFFPLVRINTRVTPEIEPPGTGETSFWVQVRSEDSSGPQPFQFHATARDLAGQEISFLAPLIFVSLSETNLSSIPGQYVADSNQRRCAARARNVAFADPSAGDTSLKTAAFYFTAQITNPTPPYPIAPFIPALDQAEVTIPALAELTGERTPVLIALYGPYLQSALDPNAGVFAAIVSTTPTVGFSADKAGGFAQPNITLTALSARKGLVAGDPLDAAAGAIAPSEFFGPSDAKLFGTIPLGDLIPIDALTKRAGAAQNAPEIHTKAKPNRAHPKQMVTVLQWRPQLQDFDGSTLSPPLPVTVLFNHEGQHSDFTLNVSIVNDLDGKPPSSTATGALTNFTLQLFGVVDLKIASIKFVSQNGAKSIVTLDLAAGNPITFDGPLQFIQTLASILPPGLFGGKGPSIKTTPKTLNVSYTLGLPSVTCGVFSLQHIAIMAGLDLPYLDGTPAVEFGFASRNRALPDYGRDLRRWRFRPSDRQHRRCPDGRRGAGVRRQLRL